MQLESNDDLLAEQAIDEATALGSEIYDLCQGSGANLTVAALALARVLGLVLAADDSDDTAIGTAIDLVHCAIADGAKALRHAVLQ
jgi:hypothetical protein